MNPDQLLYNLRSLEVSLHTPTFNQFVNQQNDATAQRLSSLIVELRTFINQLDTTQLSNIADRLDQLSTEFDQGISSLQGDIEALDNAGAVIGALSNVLGLVARIAGFAAAV